MTVPSGRPFIPKRPTFNPSWPYDFHTVPTMKCVLCRNAGVSLLVRGDEERGICEACSAIAHQLWKEVPGDAPPDFLKSVHSSVTRVYVALTRLARDNEDDDGNHSPAEPTSPNSYEFVMDTRSDGTLDLPGTDIAPGDDIRQAAERVLASIGVKTWPHPDFIEPLYTSYTLRGRLATVVVVRVWGWLNEETVEDKLPWRHAPLSTKSEVMGGFFKAMEPIFRMKLLQHFGMANRTDAFCVKISGAGAKYIHLQRLLREDKQNIDKTMADLTRRLMTDDEKRVDKMISIHAIQLEELSAQKKASVPPVLEGDEPRLDEVDDPAVDMEESENAKVEKVEGNESGDVGGSSEESGGAESGVGSAGEDSVGFEDTGSPVDATDDDNSTDEAPQDKEPAPAIPDRKPPEGYARIGKKLTMGDG